MNRIAERFRFVPVVLLMALTLVAGRAFAASEHEVHRTPPAGASRGEATALTEGVVTKVDPVAGKVGISHGPLPNLGMPAMTMVFKVKEAAWLSKIRKGDRIRFRAEKIGSDYTVVRYEPADR